MYRLALDADELGLLVAQAFGALVVLCEATDDAAAAVATIRLCAPFGGALEREYGADDDDAARLRAFAAGRCAACGKHAPRSKCARCRRVSYCGADCQRRAWPEHKRWCCTAEEVARGLHG